MEYAELTPSQGFVYSSGVSYFIMTMIVFNAFLLGVEIDVSAGVGQDSIPTWFSGATGQGLAGRIP